jgi:hypothetical protein
LLRRRWIWTFLFVLVVSASMVGPTGAFAGLVSRSLDAVFVLRDLISEQTASRPGKSPDPVERPSSEVTRRPVDPLGGTVGTPGTPPEDETVADLLPSEDPIDSSSASSLRQESDLSPLEAGLLWPRRPADGARALGHFPTAVGGAAGSASANATSAHGAATDRPVSAPFESAAVLDEIILQDIALSTSGARAPSSTGPADGTISGTTDAGVRPVEGKPPGSGEPPPVVPPPLGPPPTLVPPLGPPGTPLADAPPDDLGPPEIPGYPIGPPVDIVTDAPPIRLSPPVAVVPEPTPLLLFVSAAASWAYRRRMRAASNRRARA